MARTRNVVDLPTIEARRDALKAELAHLDEQAKAAEQTARDAGRPVLTAALERVKIAAIDKADARAIATAISKHGGKPTCVAWLGFPIHHSDEKPALAWRPG